MGKKPTPKVGAANDAVSSHISKLSTLVLCWYMCIYIYMYTYISYTYIYRHLHIHIPTCIYDYICMYVYVSMVRPKSEPG